MSPLLDIHFVTSSIEKSSAAQQLPPRPPPLIHHATKRATSGFVSVTALSPASKARGYGAEMEVTGPARPG